MRVLFTCRPGYGHYYPLMPLARAAAAAGRVFTGIELPARLPELLAIADKWQPDLIVHELSEFAGPLTAEITGIPHATCGFGPLLEPEIADVAEASAAEHYLAPGLAPAAA